MKSMKIVAPVSSINEVEMLLYNGADELYCGISPDEWESQFGHDWWLNRRHPIQAGFRSFDDLGLAVEQAHAADVPVYVTLNAPFYPDDHFPYIVSLCRSLAMELKVDGLIVGDLNLLTLLAGLDLPLRYHLSSLGGCFNSHTVNFFRKLGVERIILSRQFRTTEIQALVERNCDIMEFEVFGINDGCYFEEGYCQTTHTLGSFCMTDWEVGDFRPDNGSKHSHQIDARMADLKEYLWFQNNCGSTCQEHGLPNGPCSLCQLGWFRDCGVRAVKIVGREASFQRKMAGLQLVKAVMDHVRNGSDPLDIADKAMAYRHTPDLCAKGYMCYYGGTPRQEKL
ncbi:MAG: hypothetical protein GY866_04660 [Proteobacteria bacterium]|nr:hypothetical protein [Pseudomonadota bacterium]